MRRAALTSEDTLPRTGQVKRAANGRGSRVDKPRAKVFGGLAIVGGCVATVRFSAPLR